MSEAPSSNEILDESNEILDENTLLPIQGVIDALNQHFENNEMQCHIYIDFPYDQADAIWRIIRPLIEKPFKMQQEHMKVILYVTNSQWAKPSNHSKLSDILHSLSVININDFRVESWSQYKANSS